jgi:non-specific serine/threonine protein kinase
MLDRLASLAAKSLVQPVPGPVEAPRFAMLETTREYATELLESAQESQALRNRHADHFLTLAERAHPEHYGRAQLVWLDRVEREHDNLRAALRYFVEAGDAGRGTRLAAALRRFWWIRGHTDEARTWFTILVEQARRDNRRDGDALATLAVALTGAALFAYLQHASEALGLLAREAVALCQRLDMRNALAEALHLLGHYYLDPGTDCEAARAHFDESAKQYRAVDDNWGVGRPLNCMALSVWSSEMRRRPALLPSRACSCSARSAMRTWPPTRWAPSAFLLSTAVITGMGGSSLRSALAVSAPSTTTTILPWSYTEPATRPAQPGTLRPRTGHTTRA